MFGVKQQKYNSMKGTASVNPIFQPLNIENGQIEITCPLVVRDQHQLYYQTSATSLRWQHKQVINCTYSKKHGAVLVLCEDGKLYILTEQLDQITKLPWESKYSVGLEYIDRLGMFLMIGATEVELQYVRVQSNIRTNKFVSSMTFLLEKKQKYVADGDTKLQWNKGYNYQLEENLLYLWSSKDINFYSLDKLQMKAHITSLTKKQLSITYVYYNPHYKYTVTGLINGHIKVWRLPFKPNNKEYILIHNFIKHGKQVENIVEGQDNRIIISSSPEMLVCFWSLQTFDLLREYNFMSDYTQITLFNHQYSFAWRDGMLGKLKFGKQLEFVTEISSEVIYFDKHVTNRMVDSVQLTLASNLGFQIRDEHLDLKDLNKIDLEYIYPPLKAKGIYQIIASPYSSNQYFLLVENGEIFKVRIEDGSGKIEEAYAIHRAKDTQMHQLNQTPSIIKFLSIVPPRFDSEINENTIEKKRVDRRPFQERFHDYQLITIGCNKGTVVFFKIHNFEVIFTRVTYHRQAILQMESFISHDSPYLVSMCEENFLKIVKFDDEKAYCINTIQVGGTLNRIHGFEDRLALVFQKGFFDVFEVDEQDSDYCLRNLEAPDHEDEILSFDYDSVSKLILTAGADNRIKVWTYYKILVYEVFLDEGLRQAIWFRNCEILLSHNLKILYFRNIGLEITPDDVEQYNSQFIEQCEEKLTIKEMILQLKDQIYEKKYQPISHHQSPKIVRKSLNRIKSPKAMGKVEHYVESPSKKVHGKSIRTKKRTTAKTIQEEGSKQHIAQADLQAMRKHIEQMRQLRQKTNESVLPKIKARKEDSFDGFMKSKLINKKVLTRRDITLNRIIMKNIIREHFGNDEEVISNLKLDF